jgi:glycosidase
VGKPTASQRRIQRLVALMQMTYVGAPMIYYGTEAGMWGADDPHDRMPMVWPDMTYDPQQHAPREGSQARDTVEFDRVLYDYYRAAAWLRREHSALRCGAIEFIETEGEAKFLAFRRSDDRETLLIGLNRGDTEYRWQLPLAEGESITQVFTASGNVDDFSLDRNAAGMTVTIPPCDGVVLQLHRDE